MVLSAFFKKAVYDLGFSLRGACLEGLAEPTPMELCVHNTCGVGRFRMVLVEQSILRRSRYPGYAAQSIAERGPVSRAALR